MKKLIISSAVLCAIYSSCSHAEGYKLLEQSVSAMGNAYAGRGAQITDATLVYSNPAALSSLKTAQLSAGLNWIHAKTDYSDIHAKSANGAPVIGRTKGENSLNELVPFAFYAAPVNDSLTLGAGLYVPFGLSSDYDDDWAGRYFADETAIEVVAITGVASVRLNDTWAIGGGVNLNRVTGTLSKFKDHYGLCELGTGINALYKADVYNNAYCQSHYKVEGDDIALGYHLGVHGQPLEQLKVALVYHSAVHFNLTGPSTITNTPITGNNVVGNSAFIVVAPQLPVISKATGQLAANSQLTEASQLGLTTPASMTFGSDHQLSQNWSWQLSLSWVGWQKFKAIEIISADAKPSISLATQQPQNLNQTGYIGYIPEAWHDSKSAAIGLTWQATPTTTLRSGIAYDENPIRQSHRTARVPTTDRLWFTLGLTEQVAPHLTVDVAIGLMQMSALTINEHEYNAQQVPLYDSNLQGHYKNRATVLASQLNYRF